MSFPYKNPISPNQLTGQQSLDRTKTYGTNYSTLSTGGYMEVYSLNQLQYTIPPSTFGPIEFSGNSIPITFSKGSGATFSFDTITLQPDNISSGRRKLGMLVYVKEVNQVYQYNIDNYFNLFTAATASTGTVVFSDFGTTIKSNSAAGIAFINAWTANTIDGVGGITNPTAVWKKYYGNNISITGGSFNTITGTLTLTNITGGTQNLTGFGSGGGGGTTITGGTFDKNTETLTLSSSGGSIFITGFTDVYTTGGTYDNGAKTLELYDNSGNTVLITGFTSPSSGTTVGAYGSFSLNTNLVVSGANTETIWTYDTDEISNGIYISGGSKIRVAQYGIYSIGYSAQIEKTQGGTSTDVTIWAKLNGNNVDRSSSTTSLVSNSAYILPFVSYIFELYPEDYLEFYFSAPSQYVQLTTLSGLTSPTRPNSPSLIIVGQSVLGTVATFTGNTSATCITDLYVDNLYGCSPINVNDLLLANNGVNTSNLTATTIVNSSILDTNQTQSIDVDTRKLKDINNIGSVDWDNRVLTDSTPTSSIDWQSRTILDTSGSNSIKYDNRELINSGGLPWLNWETGTIDTFSTIKSSTISATTYQNLPLVSGTQITGGTYSFGTANFTNSTGGTFSVSGFSKYFVSASTPTGYVLINGDRWYNLSDGTELVYVNTGSGFQWIQPNTGGQFLANFLALTGGTVSGVTNFTAGINVTGGTISTSFSGSSKTISGNKGSVVTSGSPTTAFITISGSNTIGGTDYNDFIRVTNTAVGATNPTKTIRVNNTGGIEVLNNAYTAQILNLADNGNLFVGGGNIATTSLNDGVSNYLSFNLNNSQIYDDGNFHIHSRGAGQGMWLNSNNGSIIIGNQSPVAGGGAASSIIMGSGSTTTRALVNVYGSKTYTIGAYGFLATSGAGTGAGTTAPYSLYCNNRVEATEFDATSDERLKDIQGEIQLDDAINLVNNIKPIKYTWKDSEDKGVKVGYSAQQVEKVGYKHLIGHIPNEDLTATTDSDGFTSPEGFQLTMNYDQVTPYHGVVIKHLLEEIEKLKKEIEILKNK